MDYFAIQHDESRKYCHLGGQPEEVADLCYRLIEGIAFGDTYPDDGAFTMSPNSGGIVAPDFIKNPFGYFVISDKLRSLVDRVSPNFDVEFLTTSIVDHRGRKLDEAFFIMNLLATVDCVDQDNTEAQGDKLEPQFFQWIDRLVIEPTRVAEDQHLFRLTQFPKLHLASDWFRTECADSGITGMSFVPVGIEHQFS